MEMTQFSSTSSPVPPCSSSSTLRQSPSFLARLARENNLVNNGDSTCGNNSHGEDESTFLCGYQRIRRYGSTASDLGTSSASSSSSSHLSSMQQPPLRFTRVVEHRVEPTDTLQSLALRYNSSMYEIKRVNRLWSNTSLHCKTYLCVPVPESGEENSSANSRYYEPPCVEHCLPSTFPSTSANGTARVRPTHLGRLSEEDAAAADESLDQLFKRIDRNVKQTKKAVNKLTRGNGEKS